MPTYGYSQNGGLLKSAGTSVALSTSMSPAANTLILVWVAFDNLTATTPTVTSLSKPAGETNNWQLIQSVNSPQAAAAGGVRGELWAITNAVAWSNYIIQANFSASITAKVIQAALFTNSGTGGNLQVLESVGGMAGAAALGPLTAKAGEMAASFTGYETATASTYSFSHSVDGSSFSTLAGSQATAGGSDVTNVSERIWGPHPSSLPNGFTADGTITATAAVASLDGGAVMVVFGPARAAVPTVYGCGIPI